MKKIVLSIVSVLSAPVVYGVVCVPLVGWLSAQFPVLLNEAGGTYDVTLTLQIELVQALTLLVIGCLVAALAPTRPAVHVAVAVVLMMGIGLAVQTSFWDAMLVWHHFVFFACILLALPAGAFLYLRLRGEAGEDSAAG